MPDVVTDKPQIQQTVKEHILQKFLPGEDPNELTETTPLITGGILDSISTIQLVAFLEERFGVEFEAHEMNGDYLNTLSMIAETVTAKTK